MKLSGLGWLAVFILAISPAWADEPYAPAAHWQGLGYRAVTHPAAANKATDMPTWAPHSLVWPIQFQDANHTIGNSMAEFQSYGDGPYYHGGLDLRVASGAPVTTPVAGRIEAGHYGYTNHPDGSSDKFWNPWPQGGDRHYFEIAVITDEGFRFEFHHMDETRMADVVLNILKSGVSGRVDAGTVLGRSIPWPDGVYHHTHYNIVSPAGVSLNPEYYSPLLPDTTAPAVSAVIASFANGSTQAFGDGKFDHAPAFFALAVIDHQGTCVYDHPPVLASIHFDSGADFTWDFRERLAKTGGGWPPIWDFFVESIEGPHGQELATEGGYGEGVSVVKVPVPAGAHGAFTLQVGDPAGNLTKFTGQIR
ncbi:MAG TPA: hypothetical protein VL588_02965 [Bdellovibrionota bacterium]|nr:hypothetical protein [Bdellovibrionota bacterium]